MMSQLVVVCRLGADGVNEPSPAIASGKGNWCARYGPTGKPSATY